MLETIKSLLIYLLLLFIQGSSRVVVEVKKITENRSQTAETQADSDLYDFIAKTQPIVKSLAFHSIYAVTSELSTDSRDTIEA